MPFLLTQSNNFVRASTQYLSRTDSFGLSSLAAHTFEAWVKVSSQPGTNTNYGIWTLFWPTAGLRLFYQDTSGVKEFMVMRHGWGIQQSNYVTSFTMTIDRWYHVAYTYDGSNVSNFYVDGEFLSTAGIGNTTGSTLSVTSTLGASAGNSSPETTWDGNISLARLWSGVRTQAEIVKSMCDVKGTATTNMVAEWSLNNVYTDAGGGGYTWTANASPTFQLSVPGKCGVSFPKQGFKLQQRPAPNLPGNAR